MTKRKDSLYANVQALDLSALFRNAYGAGPQRGVEYRVAKGWCVGSLRKTKDLVDYMVRTQDLAGDGVLALLSDGFLQQHGVLSATRKQWWATIAEPLWQLVRLRNQQGPDDTYNPPKGGLLRMWQQIAVAVKNALAGGNSTLIASLASSKRFQEKVRQGMRRKAVILRVGKDCEVLDLPGKDYFKLPKGERKRKLVKLSIKAFGPYPVIVPVLLDQHSLRLLANIRKGKGDRVVEVRLFFDLIRHGEGKRIHKEQRRFHADCAVVPMDKIGLDSSEFGPVRGYWCQDVRIGAHIVIRREAGQGGPCGGNKTSHGTKARTSGPKRSRTNLRGRRKDEAPDRPGRCHAPYELSGAPGAKRGPAASPSVPGATLTSGNRHTSRVSVSARVIAPKHGRNQGNTMHDSAQAFSSTRRRSSLASRRAARESTARRYILRRVKAIYGQGVHWAVDQAYKCAKGSAEQLLDWACRKAVMPTASLTSRWGNRALQVRRGLSFTINESEWLLSLAELVMNGGVLPSGLQLIPA